MRLFLIASSLATPLTVNAAPIRCSQDRATYVSRGAFGQVEFRISPYEDMASAWHVELADLQSGKTVEGSIQFSNGYSVPQFVVAFPTADCEMPGETCEGWTYSAQLYFLPERLDGKPVSGAEPFMLTPGFGKDIYYLQNNPAGSPIAVPNDIWKFKHCTPRGKPRRLSDVR